MEWIFCGTRFPARVNRAIFIAILTRWKARATGHNCDRNRPQRAGDEIATRFLPITLVGGLEQMDGGQLVRVEMPRSALVSFGLPMNIERANERIKADVLIGNDGVARAIRFVR